MTNYNAILNRFINSDEFAEAIINNTKTKVSLNGSFYMVELLPDETWNVLWFSVADDNPVIPGVKRLGIPQLSPKEFKSHQEEVGTDDTQILAEALRKKDIINIKADVLRNLLHV
jgi:hypothetical protein